MAGTLNGAYGLEPMLSALQAAVNKSEAVPKWAAASFSQITQVSSVTL